MKAVFNPMDKRAFAQGNKTVQQPQLSHKRASKRIHKRNSRGINNRGSTAINKKRPQSDPMNITNIDDVIAYLLTMRGTKNNRKLTQALNPVNASNLSGNLACYVTHDVPKEADTSAKKLEKMQKRKDIRARRTKTKLAYRAEQSAKNDTHSRVVDGAGGLEQYDTIISFEDKINYDML